MSDSFWDQRYGEDGYAYGTEPNDFVRAEARRIPLGQVLCLAEGEGRNAVHLASLGHQVTAVDASAVGLAKAERLARERGVNLQRVQADLRSYTLAEGAYTGVVNVFGHLPAEARRRIHGELQRALLPGGVFLAEYYRPEQLAHGTGGPREAALLVSAADARAELLGLELLVVREVEREIREGRYHQGLSATLQLVAKRPG